MAHRRSRSLTVADMLQPPPDPLTVSPAFTLTIAPALAHALHRHAARANHGTWRCPDYQHPEIAGITWYTACADCQDFFDSELRHRYSHLRCLLDRADAGTGNLTPDQALFVGYLRSDDAHDVTVEEAACLVLAAARHPEGRRSAAVSWAEAARRVLIARPAGQVSADARRFAAARRGRAARPDRDLKEARWARPLRDDPAGLEILISFVIGVRDSAASPWDIPAGHSGGLARPEVRARLEAMLRQLRDLRPDWYDANVVAPLAQRGVIPVPADEIQDLPGARPLWQDAPAAASLDDAGPLPAPAAVVLPVRERTTAAVVRQPSPDIAHVGRLVGGMGSAAAGIVPLAWQADLTGVLHDAVRILPLLLVVVFLSPAWIAMPFLGESRRESIITVLAHVRQWHTQAFAGPPERRDT